MDKEMAALAEQFLEEARGSVLWDRPHNHRILPVEKSVPVELDIFPYERAVELVEGARSWGVRPCICRVQQQLVGKGCDHTVENCLVFAPVEGAFDGDGIDRPITKDEALRILKESAEAGLIHSTANYRDGNQYICNCCTCCCGILRGVVELGVAKTIARSDFVAVVNDEECAGCGICVDRCQFRGLSMQGDISAVDRDRCAGCGQCTLACPVEAIRLERRPDAEAVRPPADADEWRAQRIEERGDLLPHRE